MINEQGFVVAKSQRVIDKRTLNLERSLKPVAYFTDDELFAVPAGNVFIFDSECYPNFWYISFKCIVTGKVVCFELSPASAALNVGKLRWMLWRYCFVGFNSRKYDMPMLAYAMKGATCKQLKQANDFLIIKTEDQYGRESNVTTFDFEREFKVKVEQYNHIDLIEVAPLQGSLKLYAGRLHCQRMQDLPFPPDHILTEDEATIVRPYCDNDLDNTALLYFDLLPQLTLRENLGLEYGLDLRSKSDAQLAEAVINSELQKVTGKYPRKPTLEYGTVLQYNVPACVSYQSPELNAMLESVCNARFELDNQGSPLWPVGLGQPEKNTSGNTAWVLRVTVGNNVYKMGMGGLHSQEKSVTHLTNLTTILEDDDFDSFYPYIIISQRLYPSHLGEAFLEVYEKIVSTRINAKRQTAECKSNGDDEGAKRWKVTADSLKITINGSFGKLGNKYSTIYAPQLMLQVTITGQLILLMLIEMLENSGIECISANTDGVISKFTPEQNATKRAVVKEIERITGFTTEATRYGGVYNRDVNNYLATKLKFDKKLNQWTNEIEEIKVKGIYSEKGSALNSVLSKNPETLICSDALQAFIRYGTPVEQTITQCKDIRRFTALKNVKGGGEKGGKYLGKVVRWYYAKNEAGFIAYVGSGNKVSKSDGARPLMDLPEEFPDDVNYNWYIKETKDMLYDIGLWQKPKTMPLFF
jgi:hypothetical protein